VLVPLLPWGAPAVRGVGEGARGTLVGGSASGRLSDSPLLLHPSLLSPLPNCLVPWDLMVFGEQRDGQMCTTVRSHQLLGAWQHRWLQPYGAGSSGSALARWSRQRLGGTCFISWFIQTKGDYAASAVTLTDACTSCAEGTCCGYILTEVSHKKN